MNCHFNQLPKVITPSKNTFQNCYLKNALQNCYLKNTHQKMNFKTALLAVL